MSFHRPRALAIALASLGLLLALSSPASAAAPQWEIRGHHGPGSFEAGGVGEYSFFVSNVGDTAASPEGVSLHVELPAGVTTRLRRVSFFPFEGETWFGHNYGSWQCPSVAGQSSITCTWPGRDDDGDGNADPLAPGSLWPGRLIVFVDVAADAHGPLTAEATISGGGAETVTVSEAAPIGPEPDRFGIIAGSFFADVYDSVSIPERRAGSHPFRASTGFDFNTRHRPGVTYYGTPVPALDVIGTARDLEVSLPRGFVGNPEVLADCPYTKLQESSGPLGDGTNCPVESQVGTIEIALRSPGELGAPPTLYTTAVYNMVPPKGALAAFGFQASGNVILIEAELDPSDYSVVTHVRTINETLPVHAQQLTLWGVPGDPIHDIARWNPATQRKGASYTRPVRPFLSLPTECNVPGRGVFTADSWQNPGDFIDPISAAATEVVGCDQLEFEPTIVARPSTAVADAPAGLEFEMHIPQNEDPNGLATAHLRDAVVTLPPGMTVNPPSADGLGACAMSQIGIEAGGTPNGNRVTCPDSSKLGTVEVLSPAVDHPLKGAVYLAEQNANPFGSLLAMYLVIEDPETGVLVKLPGKVEPDAGTGQLTATFRNNPQLPVEELRLKLFEGPRAALKTPSTCGTHTTAARLTPWSSPEGADATPSSAFELTQGPAGGACLPTGGAAPNKPTFSAGTLDPTAKAFSPFVLKLARADGSQQLKSIDTTLPKGLVAKLAGTTYCSDAALSAAAGKSGKAEQQVASCPASSHVGSVNVGAGAGSTPLYVQGRAYLAGPYKGAPLSLAIITPAVAGPFDLGTVVVRSALHVNPESAQVRAISDEIPTILQGIPLNVRSVALKMDRPDFTLNPSSCDPMSIDGSALSVFNQSVALTNPFQVGECNRLGFKPKLQIRLKGGTKRGGHPALTATVKTRAGDANIAKTIVALPHSEFLAQSHIRTICTRVQFAANACPSGSVYGTASAITPLLDEPLSGNVYLRSSSNPLPDIVVALRGKIDVDLVGRIDSDKRGGIRTSFESVPDAPVSSFTLTMAGGKKSLLENSKNLCRSINKATAQMSAQNGMAFDSRPVLKSAGCKKARGKGKARKGAKKGKKRD